MEVDSADITAKDSDEDFDTNPIIRLLEGFLVTLTIRLNRFSRNYRFVNRILAGEKKTLKVSTPVLKLIYVPNYYFFLSPGIQFAESFGSFQCCCHVPLPQIESREVFSVGVSLCKWGRVYAPIIRLRVYFLFFVNQD